MSTSAEPPIDPNRPSSARIYDVFLGGTHNFASDRAVAARTAELLPQTPMIARHNRAFLRRAVRFAAGRGVDQFLDLGSGIPTEQNVHQVAPDARVVYVDIDPTAVLYARHLLGDDPRVVVVHGDVREPAPVLDDPAVRGLLDLSRPLGILMVAVLHFVPESPVLTEALRVYREAAVAGSVLAISHLSASARPTELDRVADLYNRTGSSLVPRDREQMERLFEGWTLVEPGIVFGPSWRPDPGEEEDDPAQFLTLAGVGVR
ncbi:SAM-dependent methyltransferase [Actinoplanes sp. NPDC023936]|uniref:SAM-dependent methyltransferase n=1 Tax=Actinoplanes sp. NPDC023936 TaxID=3154910 RepID=UPI0033D65EF7